MPLSKFFVVTHKLQKGHPWESFHWKIGKTFARVIERMAKRSKAYREQPVIQKTPFENIYDRI